MNLSSREKILIVVLLFICVIIGGYKFLLEPKMTQLKANQEALEETQQKKINMQNTLTMEDTFKKKLQEQNQAAQDSTKIFFDEMSSDDVQKWITQTGNQAGLTAVNIFIGDKEDYDFTAVSKDKTSKSTQQAQPTAAAQSDSGSGGCKVVCYQAQVEFQGTYEQILNYIDLVNRYEKACKLSNLTLNQLDGTVTVNLNVMLFSVEKIS